MRNNWHKEEKRKRNPTTTRTYNSLKKNQTDEFSSKANKTKKKRKKIQLESHRHTGIYADARTTPTERKIKMTTRSRQQLSSILAVFSIIALLLLLVFVWTAGRNGIFSNVNDDLKPHGSYRLRSFGQSDSTVPSTATIDDQQPTEEQHLHHSSHHHHHHHHHRHNESTTLHGEFLFFFCYSHSLNCFANRLFLLDFIILRRAARIMRQYGCISACALHMVDFFWHFKLYWNRMQICIKKTRVVSLF